MTEKEKGSLPKEKGSSEAHRKLVREAEEWLALNGYFAWPNQTGMAFRDGRPLRYGKKGSADIFAVLAPTGLHAEFEAKTGNAQQSEAQKIHQRRVEAVGGLYLVFRSVEDLAGQLKRAGY